MHLQTGEQILGLVRQYQVPCVVVAAADLDVFNALARAPSGAAELAERLGCDRRAMAILLDALSAIGLVVKADDRYTLPASLVPLLTDASEQSVAAMLRHQATCLRRWAQLPWVVRSGMPAERGASVRGEEADNASFIEAMNVVSEPLAAQLVQQVRPAEYRCVLDVGGGSGTWTLAWLHAERGARGVLFDLPAVIPLAQARVSRAGLADRVACVAGDYNQDALPRGADLVWVSAIIHQNSREQNLGLFRRIAQAMEPGGRVLIRDIVMDETRTQPEQGALFAVNMLVATEGGGTYTLREIRQDLADAGFTDVRLVRPDPGMNAVVAARRA